MIFEWDGGKAISNQKKHRVTFQEALTVFNDPMAWIFDDEAHSSDEKREIIIGHSGDGRLLLACFTQRSEVIRIYSARLATPAERSDYEESATT